MIVHWTTVDGQPLHGADVLREQLRWAAAERRWHGQRHLPVPHPPPPTGRGVALRGGARLSTFLEVGRARTAKATP